MKRRYFSSCHVQITMIKTMINDSEFTYIEFKKVYALMYVS